MVDEHGRIERRRHVPDVLEQEKHRLAQRAAHEAAAEAPPAEAATASEDVTPDVLAPIAPPEGGYWSGLDVRHRWGLLAAVVGGLVLVVAVAAGLYLVLRPVEPPVSSGPRPPLTVPSEVPSESVVATGSVGTSAAVEPTKAPAAGVVKIERAPLIAYRAGGAIWVSGQHGGSARSTYGAAAGAFSLSPNGLWIAYVDPGASAMRLVDVATGRTKPVGAASQVRPIWAPDSSFVLFQRMSGTSGEDVVRVRADGTGATVVMRGFRGGVMPDGRSVIAAPIMTAPSTTVAWFADKSTLRGSQTVMATEVCPAAQGVYFADGGGVVRAGGTPSAPSLRYIGYDGKGERVVVKSPASGSRAAFGSLALSPDGAWLVYAEIGDDGFSRLFAIKTAGGAPVPLTPRLDGYFMNWSSDGSEIFLVEGNAIQGEATRVSAIRPDGGGHRVVVEGGGL